MKAILKVDIIANKLISQFLFVVILTVLTVLTLTTLLQLNTSFFTHAQQAPPSQQNQEASGITLSPAIAEISPGESYSLKIENNNDHIITVELRPALFEIHLQEHRLSPAQESVIASANLTENISIEKETLEIPAKTTSEVQVNYIRHYPEYVLGVEVSEIKNSNQTDISLAYTISSIVLETDLSQEEFAQINTNLQLTPKTNIAGFNFGNEVELTTTIKNDTTKFLKSTGEIVIISNDTRIDQVLLSNDLPKTIYPKQEITLSTTYKDTRPFWQRLGKDRYVQGIRINGKLLTAEKKITTIPYQLILLVLVTTPIVLMISLSLVKLNNFRKEKDNGNSGRGRRNSRYPHQQQR